MSPTEQESTVVMPGSDVRPSFRHVSRPGGVQDGGSAAAEPADPTLGPTLDPASGPAGVADAARAPAAGLRARWAASRMPDGVGASAGAVPVVALLRARLAWLLAGALAGLIAGALVGGGSSVAATATLRLADAGQDSLRTQQVGQTIEGAAVSASVLDAAAKARRTTREDLASRVSAAWENGTDLVRVTVTAAEPAVAVADANAVADAVVEQETEDAESRLAALRRESARILGSGTLPDRAAEQARRAQLGSSLANRQDAAAAGAGAVFVADPAADAAAAGPSRAVLVVLGAFAGVALAAVAALCLPGGRLRFRGGDQLVRLAPDLRVRAAVDAAPAVAGDLLTSGRSALVVLGAPGAGAAASRFADVVATRLRGHGASVHVVDGLGASWHGLPGTPPEVLDALRHGVRDDVPARFGADLLVVACEAHADALAMMSGQPDVRVAVLVRRAGTRLAEVRTVVAAIEASGPLVVVS